MKKIREETVYRLQVFNEVCWWTVDEYSDIRKITKQVIKNAVRLANGDRYRIISQTTKIYTHKLIDRAIERVRP